MQELIAADSAAASYLCVKYDTWVIVNFFLFPKHVGTQVEPIVGETRSMACTKQFGTRIILLEFATHNDDCSYLGVENSKRSEIRHPQRWNYSQTRKLKSFFERADEEKNLMTNERKYDQGVVCDLFPVGNTPSGRMWVSL